MDIVTERLILRAWREEDAEGMFVTHTEEEQKQLMEEHCQQYQTKKVVAYCHYCTEGLRLLVSPTII